MKENNNLPTIYSPEFIPFSPKIKEEYNLSDLETLIFGFIRFYLSTLEDKFFYFSNTQLAKIFNVKEITITKAISKLEKVGLIELSFQVKNGGGKLRFIRLIKKYKSDLYKNISHINNNNINNNNLLSKDNKLAKANKTEKEYGNKLVNFVLEKFKKKRGFYPTDKKPRQRAWNLVQKVNTFIKNNPDLPEIINDPKKLLERYFHYLSKKDYFNHIENLETVVRKIEIYFGLIEKKIKEQKIIQKIEQKENKPIIDIDQENKQKYEEAKRKFLEKFGKF